MRASVTFTQLIVIMRTAVAKQEMIKMKKYNSDDIQYKGETNGVHSWTAPSGQPYYWHPDWLHIAEDATGSHPKQELDVEEGSQPTEKHAMKAILKHMNDWTAKKLANNPDIETNAIESEINLKK
ncbi:hypothetical protein I8D52_001514 [Vibrio vulnificus]|nr:hypothetical protein [Vibrio vulnificus]EHD1696074.1 hypothetical protein [Vibrio vulnificus]